MRFARSMSSILTILLSVQFSLHSLPADPCVPRQVAGHAPIWVNTAILSKTSGNWILDVSHYESF